MLARSGRAAARRGALRLRGQVGRHPRASLFCDHGHLEPAGPQLHRLHAALPRGARAGRALGARRVVLDGEVVAFDEEGRPSFERLQSRMHLASDSAVGGGCATCPVTYVIFDLLYLDGHSTLPLTYEERRELLEQLELEGPAWRTPGLPPRRGQRAARGHARAWASRAWWRSGSTAPTSPAAARSGWIKVKNVAEPGRRDRRLDAGRGRAQRHARRARGGGDGGRQARLRRQGRHRLHRETLAVLERELGPLRRDTRPFEGRQPPKGTIFVEPRLVRRVEFREWTQSGTLRAPSLQGPAAGHGPARMHPRGRVSRGLRGNFEVMPTSDLERSDQLRPGQHPGEAVQRGLAQDRALPPDRRASPARRIHQKRVSPDGEEVPYEQIVKGYEIGPDRYVMITPEELESLEPEKTRTIDIEDFVDLDQIDPIFYDHPYYLAPDTGAAKAYKLLVDAMERGGQGGDRARGDPLEGEPRGDPPARRRARDGDDAVRRRGDHARRARRADGRRRAARRASAS